MISAQLNSLIRSVPDCRFDYNFPLTIRYRICRRYLFDAQYYFEALSLWHLDSWRQRRLRLRLRLRLRADRINLRVILGVWATDIKYYRDERHEHAEHQSHTSTTVVDSWPGDKNCRFRTCALFPSIWILPLRWDYHPRRSCILIF